MSIVCLGWGSLIWDPDPLPLSPARPRWYTDGPALPVEFAHQSSRNRVTLVILPPGKETGPPVPVLWAVMNCSDPTEARIKLAIREYRGEPPPGWAESNIGLCSEGSQHIFPHSEIIAKWAEEKGHSAVVWTTLPPRFEDEDHRIPSCTEVLQHLQDLQQRDHHRLAEEYIRRAPCEIKTAYRREITELLHWSYDGSKTEREIIRDRNAVPEAATPGGPAADEVPAPIPQPKPAASDTPAASEVKLKTIEEYRIALHDKLLDARKDATEFINTYMLACYGLFGLLVLLLTGVVSKIKIGDTEISGRYVAEYVVLLIILAYILIDFHLLRLARICRNIARSSVALSTINTNAKVVDLADMHLFVPGIAGLMLAPAHSQTQWLINKFRRLSIGVIRRFIDMVVSIQKQMGDRHGPSPWPLAQATLRFFPSLLFPFFSFSGGLLGLRVVIANIVVFLPLAGAMCVLFYVKYGQIIYVNLVSYIAKIDIFDLGLIAVFIGIVLYTIWAWFTVCLSYSLNEFINVVNDLGRSIDDLGGVLGVELEVPRSEIERLRDTVQNW